MARYKYDNCEREGDVFFHPSSGETLDYSDVHILHAGVDTIRQFYNGTPNQMMNQIKEMFEGSIGAIVNIGGFPFRLSPGGKSGYRYNLKNLDLGLILLYGSKYIKPDEHDNYPSGSHLKIEVSPHTLYDYSPADLQEFLRSIAKELLDSPLPCGIAAHICADVTGWDLPDDFERNFVTRSRRSMVHSSISDCSFEGLSEVSVKYGNMDTITYGKPESLQFQIYDKTKAATAQDKITFWESVWRNKVDDNLDWVYQQGNTVRRIELRFHHSVIKQFSESVSTKEVEKSKYVPNGKIKYGCDEINDYVSLSKHLTSLWHYGLMNFRLQLTSSRIHPMWTLLDKLRFEGHEPALIKRSYEKSYRGSEKNIVLAMGNLITLYARKRLTTKQVMKNLKKSGIYDDILSYYWERQMTEAMVYDHVKNLLIERRLKGKGI